MVKERLEHLVGHANPFTLGAFSRLLYRERLLKFLHPDYWLARFGFSPYNELNIKHEFGFNADVYDNGKHQGVVMDPDKEHRSTHVRHLVRKIESEEGRIDETTQWTRDMPEARGDEDKLDLRIIVGEAGGDQKGSCTVNGYDRSIMDGVIGIPYKIVKIGLNFLRGVDEKIELMELGALADVEGVFPGLTVDEDFLRKVYTLGARSFEVRKGHKTIAYIRQGAIRRWRYNVEIYDKEYDIPAFKEFLYALTNSVSRADMTKPLTPEEAAAAKLPQEELKFR